MKPKNFPARKLARQLNAKRDTSKPYTDIERQDLLDARQIRTKKRRS